MGGSSRREFFRFAGLVGAALVPLHVIALPASAERSWSSSPCVRQALLRVQWRDRARE